MKAMMIKKKMMLDAVAVGGSAECSILCHHRSSIIMNNDNECRECVIRESLICSLLLEPETFCFSLLQTKSKRQPSSCQ